MSLGVGIGAFVSGLERGYRISTDREDREEAKADRVDDRAWRDEQRIGIRQDRAYATAERDRATGQREAVEKIGAEFTAEFNDQVAAGEAKAGDFGKAWKEFALPKMERELINQGDIEGAKKLMEWGESEDMLKGGRLFAGALFKAQTGDMEGAFDDAIAAANLKGYIADDFDIDEKQALIQEKIVNAEGEVVGYRTAIRDADTDPETPTVGYRLTFRDANGDETVQDTALDDIPSLIASLINPEAAWATQVEAKTAATKREQDLEDYRTKKQIEADTSGTPDKARTAAIAALRKRDEGAVHGSVNFDDKPRDEQEKIIAEEISFAKGTVAAPTPDARQVIVDTDSGRPVVPSPNAADAQGAPGMGAVPTSRPGMGIGVAKRLPSENPNAVINGKTDTGLPTPPTKSQLIDRAAQTMVEGGDPNEIARALTDVGVDKSEWPADLVRVLATKPAGTAP